MFKMSIRSSVNKVKLLYLAKKYNLHSDHIWMQPIFNISRVQLQGDQNKK